MVWQVAACSLLLTLAAHAPAEITAVIVLSRHGVRGPYGLGTESPSEELLKQYVRNPNVHLPLSANEWGTSETEDPTEIVSPKLTKHGYHVVELMGEVSISTYFRDHLYKEFLDVACKQTFAYADDNQRDNLTALAFLSGLYPSCKELVPITKQTQLLFEQGQDPTANCPVCSKAGITGSNDTRFVLQDIRKEVAEVNELLQCCEASVCSADSKTDDIFSPERPETCDLFSIPTQWNGAFYLPWKDTLSNTDYFSEWLLLQSLNNMTLPSQLTFEKILSLSTIHEVVLALLQILSTHMDLITNEVNSASFGATLLAHLTASFEQNIREKPLPVAEGEGPHLLQGPDNRLLYYAAHDINLLYVRNLLRLQWYTKGWHPHQPVPGSMLVFELHSTATTTSKVASNAAKSRNLKSAGFESTHTAWNLEEAEEKEVDDESRFFVKLYFVAASPEQMRNGDELTPENEVDIGDGEKDVRCAFTTFKKLMGKTLKHECVADTLRPFVDSLVCDKNTKGGPSATSTILTRAESSIETDSSSQTRPAASLETFLWIVFSALILCFVALMIHHVIKRRLERQKYGAIPAQLNTH
ncbi:hypothetical protein BBJ28_00000229 [Nothophytophthora sp. Chile5]|nr:hypothetical protein BBJ28_00000229 [Nothophytophthora sp. Chile5]